MYILLVLNNNTKKIKIKYYPNFNAGKSRINLKKKLYLFQFKTLDCLNNSKNYFI